MNRYQVRVGDSLVENPFDNIEGTILQLLGEIDEGLSRLRHKFRLFQEKVSSVVQQSQGTTWANDMLLKHQAEITAGYRTILEYNKYLNDVYIHSTEDAQQLQERLGEERRKQQQQDNLIRDLGAKIVKLETERFQLILEQLKVTASEDTKDHLSSDLFQGIKDVTVIEDGSTEDIADLNSQETGFQGTGANETGSDGPIPRSRWSESTASSPDGEGL